MRIHHFTIFTGLIFALSCGPQTARAAVIPDCAGSVEVAQAQVMRVAPNGALILTDGRSMLLEGIRLPEKGVLNDEALNALRALATAAPLTLTATAPKEDRYDRIRVQAFAVVNSKTVWLQKELLKRGLARAMVAPDRGECAPDFYEAEQQARGASAGVWAFPAYGVKAPDHVTAGDAGSFQVVDGRVMNVARRDGRVVLDFSADGQHGFSATIAAEDVKTFRNLDPPLEGLAGRHIRIRGIVQTSGKHNEIELSGPGQIELLP